MNITQEHLGRARYLVDSRPSDGFATWWMKQVGTDTHPVHTAQFIKDHMSKRALYLTLICICTSIVSGAALCWWKSFLPEVVTFTLGGMFTAVDVAWTRRCIIHTRLLASVCASDLTELSNFYENLLAFRRLALPLDERIQSEECFLKSVRQAFSGLRDGRRAEVERELKALGIDPEPATV